jgi:hypothetical protein
MPILGSIIKSAIGIRSRIPARKNIYKQQIKQLQKLLTKAQNTQIGRKFGFENLALLDDPISMFQKQVPIYDYPSIFENWWYKALRGERDVC